MTTAVVIDASAAVEIVMRTATGAALQRPVDPILRVPDGLFDAEVMSVLRRWELRSVVAPEEVAAALHRLGEWRLRRAAVTTLTADAWAMRHNLTFTDACYVALARRLDAPLLTSDGRLASAPNLLVVVLHVSLLRGTPDHLAPGRAPRGRRRTRRPLTS